MDVWLNARGGVGLLGSAGWRSRLAFVLAHACLLLLIITDGRANPLGQWSWQYPYPQGLSLNAVTYGGGQFVAVGQQGTVLSSVNGQEWKILSQGAYPDLLGVSHSDGVYVAVGVGGTILTWTNGGPFSSQTVTSATLCAVGGKPITHTNSAICRWLAVGEGGAAFTSEDGITWTNRSRPSADSLYGVTWGEGFWVVVGEKGTCQITSGRVWMSSASGTTNSILAVAYDHNRHTYAAGGDLWDYGAAGQPNSILSCTNSIPWTWQKYEFRSGVWFPSESFIILAMACSSERFVAVGYPGYTIGSHYPAVILTSETGMSWVELPWQSSQMLLYGVAHGDGTWVAVGESGIIATSPDGLTWTHLAGHWMTELGTAASNGRTCVVGGMVTWGSPYHQFPNPSVVLSVDSGPWVATDTDGMRLGGLVWGQGQFLGFDADYDYYSGCFTRLVGSPDGFDWSTNAVIENAAFKTLAATPDLFLAAGDGGRIWNSSDGRVWSECSITTTNTNSRFNSAVCAAGVCVVAGTEVAWSTDGRSWVLHDLAPPTEILRMAYGRGVFAALGADGMLSSRNGRDWTVCHTLPSPAYPGQGISYGNGLFVALAGSQVLYSYDGDVWQPGAGGFWFLRRYPPWLPPTVQFHRGRFYLLGGGCILALGEMGVPITSFSLGSDGTDFALGFDSLVGESYRIEASADLTSWETIQYLTGTGEALEFHDREVISGSQRYYRVLSP